MSLCSALSEYRDISKFISSSRAWYKACPISNHYCPCVTRGMSRGGQHMAQGTWGVIDHIGNEEMLADESQWDKKNAEKCSGWLLLIDGQSRSFAQTLVWSFRRIVELLYAWHLLEYGSRHMITRSWWKVSHFLYHFFFGGHREAGANPLGMPSITRQPFTILFTPKGNSEKPLDLIFGTLGIVRGNWSTQMKSGHALGENANSTQKGIIGWSKGSNPEPSCSEATVPTKNV